LKNGRIHDVVVIGAGPVGCYSAAGIAKKGIEVLVLEKDPLPKSAVVCTGVIGIDAFKEFSLPRKSILAQVKDISLFSPSGKEIAYAPESALAYAVDRGLFDAELREMAEQAGATFASGMTCRDFRVSDDWIEISSTGVDTPIQARMVILASGYNPGLTSKLGLDKITGHFEGVQVEADMTGLGKTEIYVGPSVAPSSFAWVLPIGNDRARIGLTTPRNGTHHLSRFLERGPIRERIKATTNAVRKAIPWGKPLKSYTTRALVVGEAAGQVKSTTHGGIYYGLIGARCAVETTVEAFARGSFSESVLGNYERSWRGIIGKEIDRGYRLRKFYTRMTDGHVEKIFDLSTKDGIMKAVREKAHFDWHSGIIASLFDHPLLTRFFR
jgi:digeranylgeranylglycerophospholipid reductase